MAEKAYCKPSGGVSPLAYRIKELRLQQVSARGIALMRDRNWNDGIT